MASKRNYKDGVFTTLFKDKEKILELFNALSGTSYDSDTNVQIHTLADVLYSVRKNDLAFSVDNRFIVLAEHQSSLCANMAFRFLLYIPRVYEKIVENRLIYSNTPIGIPVPEFYVLYNGVSDFPLEATQKLSDLFITRPKTASLELEVNLININREKAHFILSKSPTLNQYSLFVEKVRELFQQYSSRDEAVKQAINWSIQHDILGEFLKENGSEVYNMLFEEYNVETALQVREEETLEKTATKMLKAGESSERVQLFTDLPIKRIVELKKRLDSQLLNA